jgi:hypothetical protein
VLDELVESETVRPRKARLGVLGKEIGAETKLHALVEFLQVLETLLVVLDHRLADATPVLAGRVLAELALIGLVGLLLVGLLRVVGGVLSEKCLFGLTRREDLTVFSWIKTRLVVGP